MVLKGYNLGGWLSQHIYDKNHFETFVTEQDFKKMQSWGANCVRIPFDHYAIIKDDNTLEFDEFGIQTLIKSVEWSKKYSLIPILDFHIPKWHHFLDLSKDGSPVFFENETLTSKHVTVLKNLLSLFKNDVNIYIEVLNEPVAKDPHQLNMFYEKTIKSLRDDGFEHKIIIESNMWGTAEEFKNLKFFGEFKNIVYSFHFYEPLEFTHQKAPWLHEPKNERREFPFSSKGVEYNKNFLESRIAEVIKFKKRYNADVFCGEFGVYLEAPRESRYRWVKDFTAILSQNNIGGTYWNYKNMDFGVTNNEIKFKHLEEYSNASREDEVLIKILENYFLSC